MSLRKQIQLKIKSHGLILTGWYCLQWLFQQCMKPVRERVFKSYSQAGEDVLLDRLLQKKTVGVYVDVGAHNPSRFNNTRRFYERGWAGVNVEPNPDWHRLFVDQRPRDVNIGCGVGSASAELTYYEMDHPGLSCFDAGQVKAAQDNLGARMVRTWQVPVRPLKDVLDGVIKAPVDFMSIDVEGFEYQVLDSNDWDVCRPQFICIESVSDEDVRNEPVLKERDVYFEKIGYQRRAVTRTFGRVINAIYEDVRELR